MKSLDEAARGVKNVDVFNGQSLIEKQKTKNSSTALSNILWFSLCREFGVYVVVRGQRYKNCT